jgi:hypothetical protein
VKISSWRLKPDSCQTHQHKTDRLTPDSARPHHRRHHSLAFISCHKSRHHQKSISIFSAFHERRTRTVKRDGHRRLFGSRLNVLKHSDNRRLSSTDTLKEFLRVINVVIRVYRVVIIIIIIGKVYTFECIDTP